MWQANWNFTQASLAFFWACSKVGKLFQFPLSYRHDCQPEFGSLLFIYRNAGRTFIAWFLWLINLLLLRTGCYSVISNALSYLFLYFILAKVKGLALNLLAGKIDLWTG